MTKGKKIALICVNAALLALIGVCVWQCRGYETVLTSQQAAASWAGESKERFAQISAFFPAEASVMPDNINDFRRTIDAKLGVAGLEKKSEGSYWTDAYAAIGSATVQSERNSSETTTVAVGGDFFAFHPYRLLSGSYLNTDDLMQDRIVIDRELAWKLFGGTALAGQTVKINGKPYYVAGVIERESDKFTQRAFKGQSSEGSEAEKKSGTPPLLFMSYAAYSALNGGDTAAGGATGGATDGTTGGTDSADSPAVPRGNLSGKNAALSYYEIAMPNPISKFAANVVSEGFRAYDPIVIENSARYDFSNIWSIFKDPGKRSVITSPVVFPYWENAARVSEDYVARHCVFIALLAVIPLAMLVWLIVLFIRWLTAKLKKLCFNIWDAWDDRYGRAQAREKWRAQRAAIESQIAAGELPPEALPAPETAEEKFEFFFSKTKREAQKAGTKTKTLFDRGDEKKPERKPKPPRKPKKRPSLRKKRGVKPAQFPASNASSELLFTDDEQLDVERIVQEVLDEETKQDQ